MIGRPRIGLVAGGLAALGLSALPAIAAGQAEPSSPASTVPAPPSTPAPTPASPNHKAPSPERAHLRLRLAGLRHGKLTVGHRARTVGYLRPFVPEQHVRVKLMRRGQVLAKRRPRVKRVPHKDKGRFHFRPPALIKPSAYRVVARHVGNSAQREAVARSPKFRIRYPDLDPGDRNSTVRIFNRLLGRQGYFSTHGRRYSSKTGRAVMAFRKVNGMKRTFNANPGIFRKLADGRGSFHLHHPGAGRHVEVDISKQVMVLARHGEPQYTFHVSTGAPATPTIRGHYHFYSRQPGFNSHGMYYSVYFRGGYAIHGYHSVPPYPASHGCVRNPIPESKFIYRWVNLGMSIYTYG